MSEMAEWEGPKALLAKTCGHGWGKFIPGPGCMFLQQILTGSNQSLIPG